MTLIKLALSMDGTAGVVTSEIPLPDMEVRYAFMAARDAARTVCRDGSCRFAGALYLPSGTEDGLVLVWEAHSFHWPADPSLGYSERFPCGDFGAVMPEGERPVPLTGEWHDVIVR